MALFVRLMADPRVSGQLKAEIAAASAYVIIPVDLMPEAVLGPAGLIDDAIIGMIALNRVVKAMGQAGEDVLRQQTSKTNAEVHVVPQRRAIEPLPEPE